LWKWFGVVRHWGCKERLVFATIAGDGIAVYSQTEFE
jgi:hypothetical protein